MKAAVSAANATARASSRSRASTVHVDLGEVLKADVLAAAAKAGATPSDWMRAALRRAVDEQVSGSGWGSLRPEPAERVGLHGLEVRNSPADQAAARPIAVHLAADDVALIDQVVDAAYFRTRPAAVRYVLRTVLGGGGPGLDALAQLPGAIPVLAAANVELRAAARRLESQADIRASDSTAELGRVVEGHLQTASGVLQALRPLLSTQRRRAAD
jgi:hypothetical protein